MDVVLLSVSVNILMASFKQSLISAIVPTVYKEKYYLKQYMLYVVIAIISNCYSDLKKTCLSLKWFAKIE